MRSIKFNTLDHADLKFFPQFYTAAQAQSHFFTLKKTINWKHEKIKIFGKTYWQPRLTAFYAENKVSYAYSDLKMDPAPFFNTLQSVKDDLESVTAIHFTSCLANLYRNGQASNGWHADDEKELGLNPVIASLSFGGTRKFKFRRKDNHSTKFDLDLTPGSLLLMQGETQHYWQHQLPKTKKKVAPRINLTFRIIQP